MIRQKLIRTEGESQKEVNKYLDEGWQVKEFKPITLTLGGGAFGGKAETYCYVLLEKDEEDELSE